MSIQDTLPPEKLLSGNYHQIKAGIACIDDLETLRKYVGYENQHKARTPILNLLRMRADEIREN